MGVKGCFNQEGGDLNSRDRLEWVADSYGGPRRYGEVSARYAIRQASSPNGENVLCKEAW